MSLLLSWAPGPFPVTCLMVGSVVLNLAPDEHFLRPANGSIVNGTGLDSEAVEVDFNAREAQRIVVASTMTVLIGLFQVSFQFHEQQYFIYNNIVTQTTQIKTVCLYFCWLLLFNAQFENAIFILSKCHD